VNEEIPKLLDSLADRLWQRKVLHPLWRYLSAYYSVNGMTDGWHQCYDCLRDFRALCRDKLQPDELQDTNSLINKIGVMLQRQETITELQQDIIDTFPKDGD
jgi:hypothetical protein